MGYNGIDYSMLGGISRFTLSCNLVPIRAIRRPLAPEAVR